MQTHRQALPGGSTAIRWRLVSTVTFLDAAAVMLAYLLALHLSSRHSQGEDAIAVAAMVLLSVPGSVPFQGISAGPLVRLIARWGLLLAAALALGAFAGERLRMPDSLLDAHFLLSWSAAGLGAVLLSRLATPWVLRWADRRRKSRKVVIVGINEGAIRLGRAIQRGLARGQELAGYLDDRTEERTPLPEGSQRVGRLSELGDFVKRQQIDRIYVALPLSSSTRMKELLRQTEDTTASVYLMPNLSMVEPIQCRPSVLAGMPMVAVCETPFDGIFGALKRAFDLGLTLAAMPVLLPLMGVIALLVRGTSRGPVFFKQRRFGLDGREILVWKFRTMTTLEDGFTTYRQVTTNDDRVTPVGRFLRRTSLDELPQFVNVFLGSMSIVGPRPHPLAVNELCRKQIPRYMLRHKVKPGITGWAQVNGFRGGDDMASLHRRTECDLHYLNSWSLGLDVLIIWKTAVMLLRGDGNAY